MTAKTRITLSDDHPIVLVGLRKLIETEQSFELVGEATNGLAALKLILETQPDVAVIDISMPQLNGIALCRRLAKEAPAVRVLVLTLHEDRAYLKQALATGVRGYILKRSVAEHLVQGIRAVLIGGLYVDPSIADHAFNNNFASRRRSSEKISVPDLTEREIEVLKLIAFGFTHKEIASRLDVGAKSIETYKARGFQKLGLRSRAELVRYASAQGWLAAI